MWDVAINVSWDSIALASPPKQKRIHQRKINCVNLMRIWPRPSDFWFFLLSRNICYSHRHIERFWPVFTHLWRDARCELWYQKHQPVVVFIEMIQNFGGSTMENDSQHRIKSWQRIGQPPWIIETMINKFTFWKCLFGF